METLEPGLYTVMNLGLELFQYSEDGGPGNPAYNIMLGAGDVVLLIGVNSKFTLDGENKYLYGGDHSSAADKFEVCLYRDTIMEVSSKDLRKYTRKIL